MRFLNAWPAGRKLTCAFAAALSLTLPAVVMGDVPMQQQKQLPGQPQVPAEVAQMLMQARAAFQGGDMPLGLIYLKNAVNAAPQNGYVRAQLGLAELSAGNYPDAESQLRQARLNRAPDSIVLAPLFDAMLARGRTQELLAEFPDPGQQSTNKNAADILKARAIAYQRLGQPDQSVAAMDRSLGYRHDARGLLARGQIAQEQKDIGTAKRFGAEALKLDPQNLQVLIFQISLAMQSHDNTGALATAERLVQLHPNDLAARSARIEVYLSMKMDAKAKPEVDAILAKRHNLPSAVYYRALLLARAGDVKGAWGVAQSLPPEFIQAQPQTAAVVAELAAKAGSLETAGAILTASLIRAPDSASMRLNLASIRLRQNSPENALAALEPIKESSDPRVQSMLAETYLKLHRWSDALGYLEKVTAAPGAGSDLLKQQLAETELQLGQQDEGIHELSELVAKDPKNVELTGQLIAGLTKLKRNDEALKAADVLARNLPKSPAPSFYRGEVLFVEGQFDAALGAFTKSLQIDPSFIPSLYYRAGVYESLGKLTEADRDLQQILSRDPKNTQVLIKDADIAGRAGRDGDVPKLLGRAIAASPENPIPRLALANYYVRQGNPNAARKVNEDLLHVLPSSAEGLALSAGLDWAAGEKGKAIETYRRLEALQPKSVVVKLLLSQALASSGDKAGAENALEDAVKYSPDSIQARRALIILKSANGDTAGALDVANDYAAGHTGVDADLLVADALLHNRHVDQAIALLKKSLANRPDKHVAKSLASLYAVNNQPDESRKTLAEWVNKHPGDTDVRMAYASFLLQAGASNDARAQYEMVVRDAPNDPDSLNNLGWLIQKDDPRRALALVSHAARLAPHSADIVDTLGWIKFLQQDKAGALAMLQKAHALKKGDAEISYHLVVALDATGRRNDAKALLKTILATGAKFVDLANAQQLAATWR